MCRMYHFFVDRGQVNAGKVWIEGSDVNHIRNVLRMRPGEKLDVSDGSNTIYHCEIDRFEDCQVVCEILSSDMQRFRRRFIFFRDCRRLIKWS